MTEKNRTINNAPPSLSDHIQTLEIVKNKIIAFLSTQEKLEDSEKQIWIADIKEVFYSIFAAMEMLIAAKKDKEKYLKSCDNFLEKAKIHMEQSASEIRRFKGETAVELELELRRAFVKCYQTLSDSLDRLTEKKIVKNIQRIIQTSDTEYLLPCSVCGAIAVTVNTGISDINIKGIISSATFDAEVSTQIVACLQNEDLSGIHTLVKQKRTMEDGLDAYCPDCDKIYCRKHYNVREIYDEGFYDFSEGTCPCGHTRVIDD